MMLAVSNSRTLQAQDRQITQRLFCFPYAGGAASIYQDWGDKLPSSIKVHSVQLPGHGNRLREPLFKRVEPLVEATAEALQPLAACRMKMFRASNLKAGAITQPHPSPCGCFQETISFLHTSAPVLLRMIAQELRNMH